VRGQRLRRRAHLRRPQRRACAVDPQASVPGAGRDRPARERAHNRRRGLPLRDTAAAGRAGSEERKMREERGARAPGTFRLAVVQMSCTDVLEENLAKAEGFVREAAAGGADLVLLQELFENLYFPQLEREELFALAHPVDDHPFIERFARLAGELGVVLPVSFFEHSGQAYFNSLAMVDA